MYKDEYGYIMFETLEDILESEMKIIMCDECDGFLYIKVKTEDEYDDTIWKIDKKSGKASWMPFTVYIVNIHENATQIDPKTLI